MAEITDELREKLRPLKREALYQMIADLAETAEDAITRTVEADEKAEDAWLDGVYAAVEVLKTEARYHDGMAGGTGRSAIGNLYAAAVKDVEREAPRFVDQLL
jgi:hypothetical protein